MEKVEIPLMAKHNNKEDSQDAWNDKSNSPRSNQSSQHKSSSHYDSFHSITEAELKVITKRKGPSKSKLNLNINK